MWGRPGAPSLFGTNWQSRGLTQIGWQTNLNEVLWKGLPYITPYLQPTNFQGTEFVMGGLFPPVPRNYPPPAKLLLELDANSNLIYYDWEITQDRLGHWRPFWQITRILRNQFLPGEQSPSEKWLIAIAPKLGNTVTEVTTNSPKEWSLVRKSHVGFTGAELVALARWLESTGFPRFSFELPPDHPLAPVKPPAKP